MDTARSQRDAPEPDGTSVPQILGEAGTEPSPAWEQIENGRYRPRRIRGSCHGRELG
jgi:hypothetical protein